LFPLSIVYYVIYLEPSGLTVVVFFTVTVLPFLEINKQLHCFCHCAGRFWDAATISSNRRAWKRAWAETTHALRKEIIVSETWESTKAPQPSKATKTLSFLFTRESISKKVSISIIVESKVGEKVLKNVISVVEIKRRAVFWSIESVLIISLSFFSVCQYFICLWDLSEFLFGLFLIIWIFIRMPLNRHFFVGLFNLSLCCAFSYSEDLVVISFLGRHSKKFIIQNNYKT